MQCIAKQQHQALQPKQGRPGVGPFHLLVRGSLCTPVGPPFTCPCVAATHLLPVALAHALAQFTLGGQKGAVQLL